MFYKSIIRNGIVYAQTVIPRVFIQVNCEKGMDTLKTFNKIYSIYKPGGKILDMINEAKKSQEILLLNV